MNNQISKQVETGTLKYKIEIRYNDNSTAQQTVSVAISERPRMPEEPEDNISFSIGNKTLLPGTLQIPTAAVSTIRAEIAATPATILTKTNLGYK